MNNTSNGITIEYAVKALELRIKKLTQTLEFQEQLINSTEKELITKQDSVMNIGGGLSATMQYNEESSIRILNNARETRTKVTGNLSGYQYALDQLQGKTKPKHPGVVSLDGELFEVTGYISGFYVCYKLCKDGVTRNKRYKNSVVVSIPKAEIVSYKEAPEALDIPAREYAIKALKIRLERLDDNIRWHRATLRDSPALAERNGIPEKLDKAIVNRDNSNKAFSELLHML